MGSKNRTAAALLICTFVPGCKASNTARPPMEHASPASSPSGSEPQPSAGAASSTPEEAPPAPAAAPSAAPASGRPACEASEQVVPRDASDFSWVPRIAGEMLRGASRRRIACLFGEESGINGSFVTLRPHAPDRFADVLVDGANRQRSQASVHLSFPRASRPLAGDIARAIKNAEPPKTFSHHHPHERGKTTIFHLHAPADTSLRVLIERAIDDADRVVSLTLDWDDLRGWTPDRSCDEHVAITVEHPVGQHRLPAGRYSVSARAGQSSFAVECEVPASLLDDAGCRPRSQRDFIAQVAAVSWNLELQLFGHHPQVDVEVKKDGALYARRTFAPKYPTGFTCNIARETVVP